MASLLIAFSVFVVGGLVSAACTVILRRRVPREFLKTHHETLIYYFTVLTALYGLLMGFVILALWEQQSQSKENIEHEASVVHTLALLGGELPEPQATRIRQSLRDYLGLVLDEEWPAVMASDFKVFAREPEEVRQVWRSWMEIQPQADREGIILAEALDQLDALRVARRVRFADGKLCLIPYLWLLLDLGAGLILASLMFIGMEHLRSQVALTAICGGWLLVMLFVVYDLQNPFRGYWVVGPDPFRETLQRLEAGPS